MRIKQFCRYRIYRQLDQVPWCYNPSCPWYKQQVPPEKCTTCISQHPDDLTLCPQPRPDLQTIEITLPPHQEGRDRKLTFETDGTIVYEKGGEEPLDINGYRRDPNDPFRFIPLWLECTLRHAVGVRYAKCGCINIIMRCNNPDAVQFMDRVSHEQCQNCQWRKP